MANVSGGRCLGWQMSWVANVLGGKCLGWQMSWVGNFLNGTYLGWQMVSRHHEMVGSGFSSLTIKRIFKTWMTALFYIYKIINYIIESCYRGGKCFDQQTKKSGLRELPVAWERREPTGPSPSVEVDRVPLAGITEGATLPAKDRLKSSFKLITTSDSVNPWVQVVLGVSPFRALHPLPLDTCSTRPVTIEIPRSLPTISRAKPRILVT